MPPTPPPNKASLRCPACYGIGWKPCSHEIPPASHGDWWAVNNLLCTDRDYSKVELDHGHGAGLKNPNWIRIKPLIWW